MVLRGGSWNNNPRNLRASNRNRNNPDNRNDNNGFRVVVPNRAPPFRAMPGVQGFPDAAEGAREARIPWPCGAEERWARPEQVGASRPPTPWPGHPLAP